MSSAGNRVLKQERNQERHSSGEDSSRYRTESVQYFGLLLNLLQNPPTLALYGPGSALSNLVCLLLPKQTVQPARSKRINAANVIQNPGAVLVTKVELPKVPTFCLTKAKSAMSIANAMRVRTAARKDTREARRVTVIWVEKERRRATNDAMAANRQKRVRGLH